MDTAAKRMSRDSIISTGLNPGIFSKLDLEELLKHRM